MMQLCKLRLSDHTVQVALCTEQGYQLLDLTPLPGPPTLSALLHGDDPAALVQSFPRGRTVTGEEAKLLAPLDEQEVWAAGVTYKRSKVAREEESASTGASLFYDLVYTAPRPELFFKSAAKRVVHPGDPVRVRRDARWSVPEPELALMVSSKGKIVGYTIGNDMSSRDIEGENPLYLPQAKIYDGSCALGPVVTLAGALPSPAETTIRLTITRGGRTAFEGSTSLAMMARALEDLVGWLTKETSFPDGAVLLTGTGVVPPDDFTLARGDEVAIEVAGIGRLVNPVE
jgi:2-dehydro-3-deoxy-D-arabinonate dehydratase